MSILIQGSREECTLLCCEASSQQRQGEVVDVGEGGGWIGSDFQLPVGETEGVALCGGCRDVGRCRLGLVEEEVEDDGSLSTVLECPPEHEGGPEVAHGGWTAAVMDEILGHLPILRGALTVTARLTVEYVRPVPVGRALLGRSWVVRREGSRWCIAGDLRLRSSGSELARADGVWVERSPDHFARHRSWLEEQSRE